MFQTYELNNEQAERIRNIGESFLVDVKSKEIRPSKLSETVSAFANAGGGDLYIGITENNDNSRGWVGYDSVEEANDLIHALVQAHPFANHISFEFLSSLGYQGFVLHITVSKVKEIVKSTKGEVFVRTNAGKIKIITGEQMKRLELDKGISTFEDELVKINVESIENSLSIIRFMVNVVPNSEPFTYLKNQQLIESEKAKVAGILLFCDEPAVYIPKRCSVKIMRYKTKDEMGREFLNEIPHTIEGDAYTLIFEAVLKTKKLIEGIKKLGNKGLEEIKYPHDTLHEIITNAILHRDYSIVSDVQIRIFDNRVEVESPGKLPGHVTIQNILDTQSARNPRLVRLINKFPNPPNQDVGEGLDTAFRAMKDLRLMAPKIEEKDNSVLVSIFHQPLASPEELVLEYLKEHDEITNKIARDLTGIKSENGMKNVFLKLKSRSIIEPTPGKKGSLSSWRKTQENIIEKYKVINGRLTNVDNAINSIKPDELESYKVSNTEYIPLIFIGLVIRAILGYSESTGAELTFVINRYLVDEHNQKFANNVSRALRNEKIMIQEWISYKTLNSLSNKKSFSLSEGWDSHWVTIFNTEIPNEIVSLINEINTKKQIDLIV
ncbi:ATP-binding protein [Shewanella salipaludis]|uniref:ATP-dependent DNA helicase RecG n=1 Tax=Shewanella salipaludis TaxID=2723052 RepID=A0A972FU14_9GAMM|nr:ATP-binding protein [Shewanella salipaludis]NMH66175.1 ATP-dependent DNA helicase RecG [Shewanella salipaludis]